MTYKKSSKTDGATIRTQMIATALDLAADGQWEMIDLSDIAEQAGVSSVDALELFDEKTDILAAYDRIVNRHAIEEVDLSDDLPCRDKLFDLVMARFDILNENRGALLNILGSFKGDPKEALLSFPHLGKSMARLLDASGLQTNGISGALRVTGMVGLYLYVVKTWKEDESADMGKTMVTLDKGLDKCQMFNASILDRLPCS
ncbi:MAG: TetR family transcriptional regulator [Micavibrio sp.]|nr:TetR family transcriptional regulator [Micavibrio sp.]|tara:strand:+ start:690 stop:1295 length:606 start_codon:yes stop_codon:yes gene_type:complete